MVESKLKKKEKGSSVDADAASHTVYWQIQEGKHTEMLFLVTLIIYFFVGHLFVSKTVVLFYQLDKIRFQRIRHLTRQRPIHSITCGRKHHCDYDYSA